MADLPEKDLVVRPQAGEAALEAAGSDPELGGDARDAGALSGHRPGEQRPDVVCEGPGAPTLTNFRLQSRKHHREEVGVVGDERP